MTGTGHRGRDREAQNAARCSAVRGWVATPVDRSPERLTVVAAWGVIVATCLAATAFVLLFFMTTVGLWVLLLPLALAIGLPSMALAFVTLHRERGRNSGSGQRLAGRAVRIGIVGALVWGCTALAVLLAST